MTHAGACLDLIVELDQLRTVGHIMRPRRDCIHSDLVLCANPVAPRALPISRVQVADLTVLAGDWRV